MRKFWKYFILVALLGALMCTAAFAADEVTEPTFTDTATGADFTMDDSGEKFEVSYTGATSGQYLILMVAEGADGNYTINDDSIMYVNQDAGSEDGVSFTVYPTRMVNAKIMLGGGTGSPVTLGYLKTPAPNVTVNVVGSSNTAETIVSADGKTLNVENDQACVVYYTTADGEVERLTAVANPDGGYDFDLTQVPAGAEVSVAVKGDVDGDGQVGIIDAARAKAAYMNDNATGVALEVMDINGDGEVSIIEAAQIKKAYLDGTSVSW